MFLTMRSYWGLKSDLGSENRSRTTRALESVSFGRFVSSKSLISVTIPYKLWVSESWCPPSRLGSVALPLEEK